MDDLDKNLSWEAMENGLLGYLVSRTRNAVLSEIEKELLPLKLTSAQFRLVVAVKHELATTPAEFSHFLDYDSGAMKRLLDRIEDKGIIRRVPNPLDGRSVNIELTAAGHTLYPLVMEAINKVHLRLLDGFSDTEIDLFKSFLQKVIRNAEA